MSGEANRRVFGPLREVFVPHRCLAPILMAMAVLMMGLDLLR